MSDSPSMPLLDLNLEEIELVLKALGYYQVHLFDELSSEAADKHLVQAETRNVTNAIKKIHRFRETMKK